MKKTDRDSVFRGYIPLKNKRSTMVFRDVEGDRLLPEDVASSMGDYGAVLGEDTVVVDVDDSAQSDKLFKTIQGTETKCRVYETTRGKHFVFFNDGRVKTNMTGITLACGITADIKCGLHNSYIVRKVNGVERKTIYDTGIGKLPDFCIPVRKGVPDGLVSMEEGDGRNNALFKYILTLQTIGLSKDSVRNVLHIINDYIFDSPLSEKELEVIERDEAFDKPVFFNSKGQFMFDIFARFIIGKYHIVNISGRLHIWNEFAYIPNDYLIERKMIDEISRLTKTQRKETMDYISVLLADDVKESDSRYVSFRNGIYDIDEDTMIPHSPEIIVTNPIPHDYLKDSYSPIADKFLDKISCRDKEIRAVMEEALGYSFLRRNELRKSFLLLGNKANGKSTFLDMIKTILGDDNITSMDLKELGDRFKSAEMFSKLANIGDDISDDFINDLAIFKKIVSGDRINAERKNKDPFDYNPYCKLYFSANTLPRLKDRTGSVIDRMIIIPFEAEFGSDKPDYDPFIKYKLRAEESISYLISLGMKGLRRVLERNSFTHSQKIDECLRAYDEENNNVLSWMSVEMPNIENHSVMEVYQAYREFCGASNLIPMSSTEFSKQLKARKGYVSKVQRIAGKPVRIYVIDPSFVSPVVQPENKVRQSAGEVI